MPELEITRAGGELQALILHRTRRNPESLNMPIIEKFGDLEPERLS